MWFVMSSWFSDAMETFNKLRQKKEGRAWIARGMPWLGKRAEISIWQVGSMFATSSGAQIPDGWLQNHMCCTAINATDGIWSYGVRISKTRQNA